MTAKLIDGKAIAAIVRQSVKQRIDERLAKNSGLMSAWRITSGLPGWPSSW